MEAVGDYFHHPPDPDLSVLPKVACRNFHNCLVSCEQNGNGAVIIHGPYVGKDCRFKQACKH